VVTKGKSEIMKLRRVKTLRVVQVEKRYVKKPKCRKCYTKYLSFEFTDINVDGKERSQCLLCMKILAADSMKLTKI
jgi:hypothetical protein